MVEQELQLGGPRVKSFMDVGSGAGKDAMDNFRSTARAAKRRRRRVQQRLFEDGWC